MLLPLQNTVPFFFSQVTMFLLLSFMFKELKPLEGHQGREKCPIIVVSAAYPLQDSGALGCWLQSPTVT